MNWKILTLYGIVPLALMGCVSASGEADVEAEVINEVQAEDLSNYIYTIRAEEVGGAGCVADKVKADVTITISPTSNMDANAVFSDTVNIGKIKAGDARTDSFQYISAGRVVLKVEVEDVDFESNCRRI